MEKQTRKVLFGMHNSTELAKLISKHTNIPLTKIEHEIFADGEVLLYSSDTVRGCDVYVIASTSSPVNHNIMELLIFIDSLRRASAKSITLVIPYYGYARQDRKTKGRQPITAKLIANLFTTAGVDKMISVDLHNPSIQGFFDIPVDDLRGQYVLAQVIKKYSNKYTIVSPDHGGAVRARVLSELISKTVEIAIIDKRRTGPNKSEVLGIIGNVSGKDVVIIDDIIDTGGTILKAAESLKKHGAQKIIIAATHGIFSRGFQMFEENEFVSKVIVTDSINNQANSHYSKLEIATLSGFISNVILAHWKGDSVSEIYKKTKFLIEKHENDE